VLYSARRLRFRTLGGCVNLKARRDQRPDRNPCARCRRFFGPMRPHARERVYLNFLGDEGQERIRAAHGAEGFDRLVALKRRYDPENFFRANQNISPAIDRTGHVRPRRARTHLNTNR
jgi:Berberine and berberine like